MCNANYIKKLVNKIIEKYDVNPFNIVNSLKRIEFNAQPLTKNINGFYKYISLNQQIIVINSELNKAEFIFTLCHELGHYFLEHKNTLLLNSSFTMNLKEEYQADLFATYLYYRYVKSFEDNDLFYYPSRAQELLDKLLNTN